MREVTNQQGNNKTNDRRKDADKKQLGQKGMLKRNYFLWNEQQTHE